MSFQTAVNQQQAPAVAGDFASANPRASVIGPGQGSWVAGAGGVTIGKFAWGAADGTVLNAGANAPTGFVHRDQQGQIVTYLTEAGMVIQAGLPLTLHRTGDYFVKVAGPNAAVVGNKVFASNTTGDAAFGDAGATIAGYTETPWVCSRAAAIGELAVMSL